MQNVNVSISTGQGCPRGLPGRPRERPREATAPLCLRTDPEPVDMDKIWFPQTNFYPYPPVRGLGRDRAMRLPRGIAPGAFAGAPADSLDWWIGMVISTSRDVF